MCAQSSMTAEIQEDELAIAIESIWPEQAIPEPMSEIDPNIQRAIAGGEP